MKLPNLCQTLGALILLASEGWGADPAIKSVPGGLLQIHVAGAQDASEPTLASIAVPFSAGVVGAGAISSVDSANSCSQSGTTWTVNQFTAPVTYLRIKSGPSIGRFFRVTSNSSSQVSVDTGGYTLVSGAPTSSSDLQLQPGDKFELVPANTLGSVFGRSTVPLQSAPSADLADNVLLFKDPDWVVYFHDGTSWKNPQAAGVQDEVGIAPDSAVFVVRRALSPVDLVLWGQVPDALELADLPGPGSAFLANRFPLNTTLSGLGLHLASGWGSGASAGVSDVVRAWNGESWDSFFYNGSHWRKAGSPANYDQQIVPAASGLFIARRSMANSVNQTVVFPLPYDL